MSDSRLPSDSRGDPEFWGAESRVERLRRPGSGGSLLDSLLDRVREPWVGVVALVVVALLAGVVFYEVGSGSSDAAASPAAPRSTPRRTSSTTSDPVPTTGSATPSSASAAADGSAAGKRTGSTVVVHVAGAVVTPGVVTLAAGSRVIDAVEAAGGGLPNADLDRLNLAAKAVDGQRVLVQHVGDPPAAADPSGSDGSASASGPAGPLNLNAASEADLEQLPGIGPSLAQAIIAERTKRGGFRSVNELREVRGIGERRFADLKTLVTV